MKKGLCHQFQISCRKCEWSELMKTSKTLTNDIKGKQYDINIHSVIAFREIGKGYAALESFCYIMNMLPPMTRNNYDKLVDELHEPYMLSAQQSMKNEAFEGGEKLSKNKENLVDQVIIVTYCVTGCAKKEGIHQRWYCLGNIKR